MDDLCAEYKNTRDAAAAAATTELRGDLTERNPYNEEELAPDHAERGQGAHERPGENVY